MAIHCKKRYWELTLEKIIPSKSHKPISSKDIQIDRKAKRQDERQTEAIIPTMIMKTESGHMVTVLARFMSNGYKLKSSEGREPRLKQCFHKIRLYTSL